MPVRHFTPAEVHAGRRALEIPLFLTVFLAAAMFALAEGSLVFLVISWAAVVVHMVAAERNVELYAHRTVLNAGVVLVGIVLTVRFFTTDEDLLIALGHYVTLIQLCKLFERKRDRDYVQMLVMSLLLVLAAAMICQELLFALLGLIYVVSLCYTAMAFTLKRNLTAAALQQASARRPDAAAGKAWPTRAILSRLAVALPAVLATGVVIFLVSPRTLSGTAVPLRRGPAETISGFTDSVRLGRPRSIYLSDRVVMHLQMLSPEGINLGDVGKPYLRGHVYTEYVDSRWARPASRPRQLAMPTPRAILDRAVRQEVSMVPSLLPAAFAAHPAVKLTSPDASVRRLDNLEYELRTSVRLDRPVRYTAHVLAGRLGARERGYLQRVASSSRVAAELAARRLRVPERVVGLARQWCGDLLARRPAATVEQRAELDLAVARRIAGRLMDRCDYTLDLSEADAGRDGVEDFLFHLRRGHCEYFASAMTVMCQAMGVRARLATGFVPAEFDDEAMRYVVRQRDAHAWTEVYTPLTGWATVDATPAARFDLPAQSPWPRWWLGARDLWREWEFAWYANVIGYDDEARRRLASRWRGYFRGAWDAVRDAAGDVFWGLVELFARGRISPAVVWFFLGVAAVAGAVSAGLLLLRRRPGRSRRRPVPPPKPPAFLVQLLTLLRRYGVRPMPSQTPRELARQAAGQLHLPAETLEQLVALYYRIRWAGAAPGRDEIQAAEARVRRLAEMLST